MPEADNVASTTGDAPTPTLSLQDKEQLRDPGDSRALY